MIHQQPKSLFFKIKYFPFFTQTLLTVLFLLGSHALFAQVDLPKDSVNKIIETSPAFTIFKDNYFIVGVPLNEKPNGYNSDAKFQFSFKYRINNEALPGDIYSYFTYSQKSFWDIFRNSSPFAETNYNPGLLLIKPLYSQGNFSKMLMFSIEHESNGRDSTLSRSWNFISLRYMQIFSKNVHASLKLWAPIGISDNPDITKYIGYGEIQMSWMIMDNKLFADASFRMGENFDRGSLLTEISWKPFPKLNQYLTLQWWQGTAENLLDYKKNTSMIRLGIILKPNFMRFY